MGRQGIKDHLVTQDSLVVKVMKVNQVVKDHQDLLDKMVQEDHRYVYCACVVYMLHRDDA